MREVVELRSLLQRERRARQHRMDVTRLAARTSGEVSRRGVAEVIAAGAGDIFHTGWVIVAFVGDDEMIQFVHGPGVPAEIVDDWGTAPLEVEVPIATVLRGEAERVSLGSREEFEPWPLLVAESDRAKIGSLFVEPVKGRRRPHAVVTLAWPTPYQLDEEELDLLRALVDVAAPAFERAIRTEADRDLATTLQEWLLPRDLPDVDGLDLATLYRASREAMQVGGDWYDVVPLDDRRSAIVIGDVVGHDVRAVAEMAQVRHVLASHLMVTVDPAASLSLTDQYLHRRIANTMATALVILTDPVQGTVELASAGHLPPVLARADAPSEVLACGLGPPLGSGLGGFRSNRHDLPPGAVCVAMTDGVVELRGETIDSSLAEFCRALDEHLTECSAGEHPGPTIDTVVDLLHGRVEDAGRTDDAAAIVFCATPSTISAID